MGPKTFAQFAPPTETFEASASLFPDLTNADALVGAALSQPGSLRHILLPDGRVARATVEPRQPEGIDTNSAVVVAMSDETLSGESCLVVLEAFASHQVIPRLGASLDASGGALTGYRQLTDQSDPVERFQHRTTRYLPPGLALLGAIATSLLVWSRSSELSAYRLSGMRASTLGFLLACEQCLIAGCFATAGAESTYVVASDLAAPSETLAWSLCGAAVWMVATATMSLRTILASVSSLVKDR